MEALVLLCCSTQILSCIAGCNMRLWICNVVQHRSSATLLVAAIEALVLLCCSNRSSAAKVAGDQPVKLLVAVVFKINSLIAVKSITLNQLQIPFNLNLEHNCSRTQKDEQKMARVVYTINLVKETWKIVRLKMLLLGFTNLSLWETNFMDHGTIVVGTRIFFNKFHGFRLKHFELVILMDTQFGCFKLVNWFCCQSTEKTF